MATRESRLGGKACWRVRPDLIDELGVASPGPTPGPSVAKAAVEGAAKLAAAEGGSVPPVATRPTELINPAMRAFLKPQASVDETAGAPASGDGGEAAAAGRGTHAEDGGDAVKTLFKGEGSPTQRGAPPAAGTDAAAPLEAATKAATIAPATVVS